MHKSSRIVIVGVQVGVVKIYVATVEVLILYINSLRSCVRLSDTTILRFNSSAESA